MDLYTQGVIGNLQSEGYADRADAIEKAKQLENEKQKSHEERMRANEEIGKKRSPTSSYK